MYEEVNNALEVLRSGGIILYPTDTVWGIGCDATNATAISRIYALKQRADSKSMIILLPEAKDVFKYTANPNPDIVAMLKQFDRPTTVIYTQALDLPDNLVGSDGSIAIRITKDPFCKMLLKRLKLPLVSTSANISGRASAASFKDMDPVIKQGVDYIVKWRQEEDQLITPSRIIRLKEDGTVEVIRP